MKELPEATGAERASLSAEEAIRRVQMRREAIANHELDAIKTAHAALNKLTTSGRARALDFLHSSLRDSSFPEDVPF